MLKIKRLTTENLQSGCVTDAPAPRFAFALESSGEGVQLAKAVYSVNGWQTETTNQVAVPYTGEALRPHSRYTLAVEATDNRGETATAEMEFETGFMGGPWQAKWITDTSYHFTERKVSPVPLTFRRGFAATKAVQSARLYCTAMGVYELDLNGEKVGSDYFAPGYTSYKHQLQYQTYDVTHGLRQGENTLVAVVSGGWAVGSFTHKRQNRLAAKRQALLCEMHITYTDGSTERLTTDESWQVTRAGNYKAAEFYDGEVYDATVDLDKAPWRNAGLETLRLHPQLLAGYGAPVRARQTLKPVSCHSSPSGKLIYDFGQNFSGVIHAVLQGRQGQTVTFRHAEILMDGELYTEPLRTAKATAVYTCREGAQAYSPRHTSMGFRYVEVTGIAEADIELTALVLYSDMETTGSFACSNEMINQLQSNIQWSAKSNFLDIPTDCPQRDERLGWTGDIALFAPTASYNFNTSRFLQKWLLDVKAQQRPTGGIPVIVPWAPVPGQWEIMIPMAVAYWGDCCILVPYAEYQARGDIELLRSIYPTMKRYLKAVKFWAGLFSVGKRRRIWRLLHQYGDWCAPGLGLWQWMGRGKWTATACWANSCGLMAEIAALLGEQADAEYYKTLREEICEAYTEVFTDKKGRLKKEFQSAYVLPLQFGMFPAGQREAAAANLAALVNREGHHIRTGFPGTPYLLFALADNGYEEDAYKMLLEETCPSWLYTVKAGATTIWERWDALREDGTCNTGADDGTNGMVSFNHYAYGAVGDFLYKRVAGLEALTAGYKHFQVAPLPGGGLTWAKAEVETPYGTAGSHWRLADGRFTITVQVPVGTSCTLRLPSGALHTLQSGTHTLCEEALQ